MVRSEIEPFFGGGIAGYDPVLPARGFGNKVIETRDAFAYNADVPSATPAPIAELIKVQVRHCLSQRVKRMSHVVSGAQQALVLSGWPQEQHCPLRGRPKLCESPREFQDARCAGRIITGPMINAISFPPEVESFPMQDEPGSAACF